MSSHFVGLHLWSGTDFRRELDMPLTQEEAVEPSGIIASWAAEPTGESSSVSTRELQSPQLGVDFTPGVHMVFPGTAVSTPMPEIRNAFLALPEMQRLVGGALKNIYFLIVGGAVRDILRNPKAMPKDIDCQVDVPSKEHIHDLVKQHYEESEVKIQPLAVTVGNATESLDGIDLLVAQPYHFDPAFVENDVNALMFDLQAGVLIDPFGTGLQNLRAGKFRIVEQDMEAWYSYKIPDRKNNGKGPRILKMINMGLSFEDTQQQAAFVACLRAHLPKDLTDKVIAKKFSVWAMVLGMNIRGDTFDFKNGSIQLGTCPSKLAKYKGCLAALVQLDGILGQSVQDYMAQVSAGGACP